MRQLNLIAISETHVKDATYYYLKYRAGKKVVSQYIRSRDIEAVKKQIPRRRHIETRLQSAEQKRRATHR